MVKFQSVISLSSVSFVTYLLTYLLTELSPSWEAVNCAATQELPSILRNPKVHHGVHKSPPLVPILSQIDPVHTIPFYISLRSILILSTHLRLGLPSGLFPSGFPTISYMHSSSPPFVLHALPISILCYGFIKLRIKEPTGKDQRWGNMKINKSH
jgi:hypothetical protein